MTNVVNIAVDDERTDAANRWVLRIDEGINENQHTALQEWLSADARNVDAFLEAADVWDETESLSRLAEIFPQPAKGTKLRPRLAWSVATGAVLALVASFFLLPNAKFNELGLQPESGVADVTQRFETAVGEQSTAVMVDGTVVVLNTNSALEVHYSDDARVLRLLRGEILVDVFEDPSRPLSVIAGDRIVQALGTEFSLEITLDHHVELVVTEGTVIVGAHRSDDPDIPAVPPILAQSTSNTVVAGEELLMVGDDDSVVSVSEEDMRVKLSWRDGSLIFVGEPLEKAVAEMERYTTVKFVFTDEDLKQQPLTGRFRAGDVEAMLLALRLQFRVTHEIDTEGRVLLSSL